MVSRDHRSFLFPLPPSSLKCPCPLIFSPSFCLLRSMASSSDSGLSINIVMHLITNKTSSSNYLLWRNQLLLLLTYQGLLPHIDGSSFAPSTEIFSGDKSVPNSTFDSWLTTDQRAAILLQASLTEEAFFEIVGL